MELVPMVALGPVPMVTKVLARMAFHVPKEAEASLLLSPELTGLVIPQELVELAELHFYIQARGASGIGCIGASCNGGAGAAGGAGGSNFGLSGSVSGGAACQQVVSGAQACSTGTGGSANGGSSGPGGVGGLGIGGTGGKGGDASGGVGGLGG